MFVHYIWTSDFYKQQAVLLYLCFFENLVWILKMDLPPCKLNKREMGNLTGVGTIVTSPMRTHADEFIIMHISVRH